MTAPLSGQQAAIIYVLRSGERRRWQCKHMHRTEESAFACAVRETRRRFATTRPRADVAAFNVMTAPVWNEPVAGSLP